jgi:hypothetical protein
MPEDQVTAVKAWAKKHTKRGSLSEAIRKMIEIALGSERPKKGGQQ